jgi:hypothetical protein
MIIGHLPRASEVCSVYFQIFEVFLVFICLSLILVKVCSKTKTNPFFD